MCEDRRMPSPHADRLLLLLLGVVVFSIPSPTSAIDIAAPANLCAQIGDLEVEHRSALKPAAAAAASAAAAAEEAPSHWTPPVLDANEGDGYRFEWRVAAALAETDGCHGASTLAAARNVTQLSAVLTLTPTDRPNLPSVICRPTVAADRSLVCGSGPAWQTPATRWGAKLEVVLRGYSAGGRASESTAVATGWFVRGLPEGSAASWGGAAWIGLPYANDTALQFRGVVDIHAIGFDRGSDVVRAMLFVSGLGGYRAAVNGRAIDPTSIRASVTEWHNRTYYWADDVTSDVAASAESSHGTVLVAIEIFKHWYGLSNNFYSTPYGARALKAVIVLTHTNGTDAYALPTMPGEQSGWRHNSGSILFDDLHVGQTVDGRLATPNWDGAIPQHPNAYVGDHFAFEDKQGWVATTTVPSPPGELRAHPMQHSRVLEVVTPANVTAVPRNADNVSSGMTYALFSGVLLWLRELPLDLHYHTL